MPYKIKGILLRHNIPARLIAAAVMQDNDKPLSPSGFAQIVNHSYFPATTNVDEIKRRIVQAAIGKGIPASELADAWEFDDEPRYHAQARPGTQAPRAPTHLSLVKPPEFKPLEIEMLTPQAKRHFKLFRDPFIGDVTSADDVYYSAEQQYIVEAMIQTALVGGITAAIGESGSGKTTLRKLLRYRISNERTNIRLIFPLTFDKTKLNTASIGAAIINDLEPETIIKQKNEAIARQVGEVLKRSARAGNYHVLILEEAHDLSITTLKYLKRFNEIESDDGFGKLLAVVLIGQPELRVKLDANRYPEAREFINRCEVATLPPLMKDLEGYLRHKFSRAGLNMDDVLATDAIDGIRERWTKPDGNGGYKINVYPLVVNNTVTAAMNRAAQLGLPLVTGDLVKEL